MGIDKIRKKSEVYAKHGKHKSVLMETRALKNKPKRKQEMYSSVKEAFDSARKKH